MAGFGGTTEKPSKLWSSESWVSALKRGVPKTFKTYESLEVVKKIRGKNGKTTVNGGKDLQGTQAYPDGYGTALRDLWRCHRKDTLIEADDDVESENSSDFSDDDWKDAGMEE